MEFSELIYPSMRKDLLDYLEVIIESKVSLSDCDFDNMIHFFFDDTSLSRDSKKTNRVFLLNEKENSLISGLINSIDGVFDKYGTSLSADVYVNLPEWDVVILKADKAYQEIKSFM